MSLSLGLVNGRNVWRNDLEKSIALGRKAAEKISSQRVLIAPSCSLFLSPVDLEAEKKLDPEIKGWMAYATQKLEEISLITKAVNEGDSAISKELEECRKSFASHRTSAKIHNPKVKQAVERAGSAKFNRSGTHSIRKEKQQGKLDLPLFPTTTIGSFSQTDQVRKARADHKAGKIDDSSYEDFLREETRRAIRFQEEVGLDVLVHGEFERNDMVEYFGEQLEGFAHTENGWVQSYGSRCVKPPVVFGDVSRPAPITVGWWKFAQECATKPVKGMLTGPVTILQWSFVREDQERSETCKQIALAIREEVSDLETAGAKVIQIDEPAIREGLPLRREDWAEYLEWAVKSFRISSTSVKDETQIHTHMCYSEFNDIIDSIGELDADVISIETSRSQMELLGAFADYKYPNDIGPGVYDIHTPRIPSEEEIVSLLKKALHVLDSRQVWVNPDCGLKTRKWEEIKPALAAMTAAARKLRLEFGR